MALGYLGGKDYLGQRKIRSLGEQQRGIKEVGIEEINKDINLESRSPMVTLRLLEPCSKAGFNGKI